MQYGQIKPQRPIRSILITRPLNQADHLVSAITESGLQTILLPIFRIEPCIDLNTRQKILHFNQYDIVIVTSKNAASVLIEMLDTYWPQLPARQIFFAIGSSTARYLAQHHIKAEVPEAMHSEGLIRMILTSQKHLNKVIICKGVGGRNILEQTLGQKADSLEVMELYRRVLLNHPVPDLITKFKQADLLICTSEQTLMQMQYLADKVQIPIKHLPIMVSSRRLAERAATMQFTYIYLSDNATDKSLVISLQRLLRKNT